LKDQLRLALVGAGYWGKNLARNFHELGVLKIICDASEEVLLAAKEKYPDISTTLSFGEVLARHDIDAIIISTPAELHHSLARDSLLAGKHVFVEKPLAMNTAEGEELVRLAHESGKILFVGHVLQYHPAIKMIKSLLKEGKLGKLQYIYSNRLNLGKFRREENSLWSFAPHDISVILSLVQEEPILVYARGSNILHPKIADSTLTHLKFPSGVDAHIFVSWLHPFKEQKLVVIGDRQMVVFDDVASIDKKLMLYPYSIQWGDGAPVPDREDGIALDLSDGWQEPLALECRAFLDALSGAPYLTDGEEGLRVLKVLEHAQTKMDHPEKELLEKNYFAHTTSVIDPDCQIGTGTKIWHFSHIMKNSQIGTQVTIGQNVTIGPNAVVGNRVKIQNNVSVYEGVVLEDDVFCGPSCVFTNVENPRSIVSRKHAFKKTLVKKGATLGANATIRCGITIGSQAFIGAGAMVTRDVPDHALVYGNPAVQKGWVCHCGGKLDSLFLCEECGSILKHLENK
jgi:UDP-2-acetamido-3-amino-2,3-dideoxy-glucuronate N-acetyltransferase